MKNTSHLEFTITAILVGVVVGVVMTAANVYLGLYAGMTVSASIPAAVIGMAIFRGLLKQNSVLQSNIVQTIASAGESLAAGVIFTVPALVLVGAWSKFEFWPTTLIAVCGGLLGIAFMVPLRKALIVDSKELTYPEGVACAAVLEAGNSSQSSGVMMIMKGLLLGGLFKFLSSGLNLLKGSVEAAGRLSDRVFFMGSDISPALLAVGYIVGLEISVLVFIGGALGWFFAIPLLGAAGDTGGMPALDAAWTLWSTKIRYVGVGSMIVGGIWSIFTVRKGIKSGLQGLSDAYKKGTKHHTRTEKNVGLTTLGVVFFINTIAIFGIYHSFIGVMGWTLLTTTIMIVVSFFLVAISSYIVGLVGSSNNPVSGMTISALLGTAALFIVLGFEGQNAILATLGVASVVCCAACTAGDCSQDLKTGVLVGATPRSQQLAQMIGTAIPAFVIAPVLTLLHSAYGIGDGLKAPQATLFASITQGLFGNGHIPYDMVSYGVILGIAVIIIDQILVNNKSKFRAHLMPMAVGIYLPVTLAVPILMGGLVKYAIDKKLKSKMDATDNGTLMSSGLIAGEAIMGVIVAVFLYLNWNLKLGWFSHGTSELLSIAALLGLTYYLYKVSRKKRA